MRVVSLNLDHGDATVVRRALRQVLAHCSCGDTPDVFPCADCQALRATLLELDRLVQRPTLGRTPLLTVVAANGRHHVDAAVAASERQGMHSDPGLRLVAGDGGRGT